MPLEAGAAEGLAVKSSAAANGPYPAGVGGHVRATGQDSPLISALDDLTAVAADTDRDMLAGLRDRLLARRGRRRAG